MHALSDQLEFLTMLMRDWNAETARWLREDLGCKQIINAGNWKSVDPVTGDDAERYSYTANEVMGKNAYYGAIHNGINRGWQILEAACLYELVCNEASTLLADEY